LHNLVNWLISAILLILIILIIVIIVPLVGNLSDNVLIAIIGAITASITIIGSVFVAKTTGFYEGQKQRQIETRNLKREFYNQFIEVFTRNMSINNNPEINQNFCIEVNRLPMYASQEVVEFVNEIASKKNAATEAETDKAEFAKLFSLIRADLCSDDYKEFTDLKTIYFQFSQKS